MALTGGRHPYDPKDALIGPFNALIAPTTVAVPADLYDIVNGVRDVNGIYQPQTGWFYAGLATGGHGYSHSRDTDTVEYENVTGGLFESITDIQRNPTIHFASLNLANLKIIENTTETETIAATTNQAPQTKVSFGLYDSLLEYRVALIGMRPESSTVGLITEGTSGPTRPPMYGTVFPLVRLGTNDHDFDLSRGNAIDVEVEFDCVPEPSLPTAEAHGFHVWEDAPATIATS